LPETPPTYSDCWTARAPRMAATTATTWPPGKEQAFRTAHIQVAAVSTFDEDDTPLSAIVEASVEAVADVVVALHRDRLGVPEALSYALGSLLVLYVAGTGMAD
jgi:hypothetical protein